MAYEAMNNAGAMDARLIVILNDNDMSIAPPVGAMSAYLARLVSSRPYRELRELGKRIAHWLPKPMELTAKRAEEYARGMAMGGTLFEEMGFYYVGPIDGHNLDHLIPVLENVRDTKNGPILIHVVTQKGKGYRAGRGQRRQISWRLQVQRADRRAEEVQRPRPRPIRRCSARSWSSTPRRTTASSPSPRRCPAAPASTCSRRRSRRAPSMSASPSSMR